MNRMAGGVLVLFMVLPSPRAADNPKDKPGTPAEQYEALVEEHAKAEEAFFKALSQASDEEAPKLLKEKYPNFGSKFLELAEKNPNDPIAVDALVWVATNSRFGFRDKDVAMTKALEILLRDHLQSSKLAKVCQALAYSGPEESANAFLLAALAKSKRKDVQAEACVALIQRLAQRAEMIEQIKRDPNSEEEFTKGYGREYVEASRKDTVGKIWASCEWYFSLFKKEYIAELPLERLLSFSNSFLFSTNKLSEAVLRELLEKDARAEVQGPASLTLARVLCRRAEALDDPESKKADNLLKESEDLLEKAVAKYADVKLDYTGSVGKRAKRDLYSLRNLSVGKVAPNIEGEDQDGKKFKLSDYRGKVVMLDFWSESSRRSRAFWPHERVLVKDMDSKPFALIGVNSDCYSVEKLKMVMDKEKLTWRTFCDPKGENDKEFYGPICTQWNLEVTIILPSLYVIDHKGVIRYKWHGGPTEKALEDALAKLIKEAERGEKKDSK